MKLPDYTILIEQHIPRERVADVLCSALEGGSNYWCSRVDVFEWPEAEWAHEAIANGGKFQVQHFCEDDDELLDIMGEEEVTSGLKLLASKWPAAFGRIINEQDDAYDADMLFQLICFGEVVYG